MRIGIFVKYDLPGLRGLNEILDHLHSPQGRPADGEDHIMHIWFSDLVRKSERENPITMELLELLRFGPCDRIFPLLEQGIEKSGQDSSVWSKSKYLPLKQLLAKYPDVQVTHLQGTVNKPEYIQEILDFRADVCISCRFDYIFKGDLLHCSRLGLINVHPGILPQYGGVKATFRAFMNGDDEVGCTVHLIDVGIDTGAICGIARMPIEREHSMMYHEFELYLRGLELWKDQVWTHVLRFDKVDAVAQDGEPRYYSFPTTEDVHAFFDRGFSFVNLDEYVQVLQNFGSPDLFALDAETNAAYQEEIRRLGSLRIFNGKDVIAFLETSTSAPLEE